MDCRLIGWLIGSDIRLHQRRLDADWRDLGMKRQRVGVVVCSFGILFLAMAGGPSFIGAAYSNAGHLALNRASSTSLPGLFLLPARDQLLMAGVETSQLLRARDLFDLSIRLNPDLPGSHYGLGIVHWRLSDPGKALASLERTTEIWPEHVLAQYLRGNLLQSSRRHPEAIQAWRAAQLETAVLAYGRNLYQQSRCAEAESYLLLATEIVPESPEAFYALGQSLWCQAEDDRAALAFERAASLYPPATEQHYLAVGHSSFLAGEWDEAMTAYQIVVTSGVQDRSLLSEAHAGIYGVWAAGRGNAARAAEALDQMLALSPTTTRVHVRAANLARVLGDEATATQRFDAARAWYRQAQAVLPDHGTIPQLVLGSYVAEGYYYLDLDKPTEASEAFRGAIAACPGRADGYVGLGKTLLTGGDRGAAVVQFETAIEVDPQNVGGYRALAQLYSADGDHAEAVEWWRRTVELVPQEAEYHARLGQAYYLVGDLAGAAQELEKAVQLRADAAWYHQVLGDVHRDAGHLPEAIEAYRRALALSPGWEYVEQQLRLLTGE